MKLRNWLIMIMLSFRKRTRLFIKLRMILIGLRQIVRVCRKVLTVCVLLKDTQSVRLGKLCMESMPKKILHVVK